MTDRWSSTPIARCPDELADAVEVARRRHSEASDYIRQAVVAALQADGVDLASSNDCQRGSCVS